MVAYVSYQLCTCCCNRIGQTSQFPRIWYATKCRFNKRRRYLQRFKIRTSMKILGLLILSRYLLHLKNIAMWDPLPLSIWHVIWLKHCIYLLVRVRTPQIKQRWLDHRMQHESFHIKTTQLCLIIYFGEFLNNQSCKHGTYHMIWLRFTEFHVPLTLFLVQATPSPTRPCGFLWSICSNHLRNQN